MSDIGAIFHVRKNGVQYNAHAYTTIDECPYPNLKIRFNGTNAFVKLENRGNGDVPLYVKMRSGEIYQVKKEAIPTGQITFNRYDRITLIIPAGITVLQLFVHQYADGTGMSFTKNIKVTPGTTHTFYTYSETHNHFQTYYMTCATHEGFKVPYVFEYGSIKWSAEINKQETQYTHTES